MNRALGRQLRDAYSSSHPQILTDSEHEPREIWRLHELDRARTGQRHVDHGQHASRSGTHDDDPVGEEDRLDDAVRHEDDGLATLLPDPQQLEVQPFARELVDRPERLIHQDNLWIDNQDSAERGALLHAARQLGGIGTLAVLEPDQAENVASSVHGAPAIEPEDLDREQNVLENGPPGKKHWRLKHHADVAPRSLNVEPTDGDPSGGRLDESSDQLQ